ncbi:MAG: RICIN domain-containing protein [Cyanobacteria bacterium P01_D01_bin.36]
MNIFQKALQPLKAISVPKKTLAVAGLLAVALPMSFTAGEAKAVETFRLESGVALNTNNRFRRIYGQPRMSLWRHNINDRDQQFTRLRNPDGSYRLQHRSTGKCLNAHHKWNGGEVNVWPCNPHDADQKFDFVNVGSGASLIRRRGTNLCVDAPTFTNYGRIHLWQCMSGNPHQRWFSNNIQQTGNNVTSARPYQSHEHPFANMRSENLSQSDGNEWCRGEFWRQLSATTGGIYRQSPYRNGSMWEPAIGSLKDGTALTNHNVNHVWAHLSGRQCVANRRW